jgi:hypothetical protein
MGYGYPLPSLASPQIDERKEVPGEALMIAYLIFLEHLFIRPFVLTRYPHQIRKVGDIGEIDFSNCQTNDVDAAVSKSGVKKYGHLLLLVYIKSYSVL